MAVTQYTEWIFRGIGGKAGRGKPGLHLELRINRGNDVYDWAAIHPTDSIICKDHKIVDYGKLKQQRYDEDADIVLSDRTIIMRDVFFFNGVVNGTPTGNLDLYATQRTSRIPFIFSDPNLIYYAWLSQLNTSGTLIEIYQKGQFQFDLKTGQVIQVTKPMTSNEAKLQRQKLVLTTMTDVLKAHMAEELVSGTNLSNPNLTNTSSRFVEGDMTDTILTPWYIGLSQDPSFNSTNYDTSVTGKWVSAVAHNGNINDAMNSGVFATQLFFITHYPCQHEVSYVGTDFFDGTNPFGVNHGFRGVSITTLLNKMGGVVGFDFAETDADPVFTSYFPIYNVTKGGYDISIIGNNPNNHTPFDTININYNVKFGVKPYIGTAITHDSPGGMDDVISTNFTCSNTNPIVVTTASAHGLISGDIVEIEGVLGNTNANNAITGFPLYPTSIFNNNWTVTVLSPTTFSIPIAGNGADAGGDKFLHHFGKDWYEFSTPITWARTMSFAQILNIICIDFGLLVDWEIYQSGAKKGQMKLVLRNPLKSIGSIPSSWKDAIQSDLLDQSDTQERILSKTNVKLHNLAAETFVYCPSKLGESKELQIDGRAKKWGDQSRILANDMLMYDATNDIAHQEPAYRFFDVAGAGIDFNTRQNLLPLNTQGWIGMSNYFVLRTNGASDLPNFLYPDASFAHLARGINGGDDWYGYVPVCYQDYMNAFLAVGAQINPDNYNTIGAKAVFYANYLLLNTTIEKREFNSIVDDSGLIGTLKPLLSGSWQDEDGTVTEKLIHSIELSEEE